MQKLLFILTLSSLLINLAFATEKMALKIGVQTSGTLDWELSILPVSTSFQFQIQSVATAEAAKIALQSGAVDLIVSDWLWVSQTRNKGTDFTFYPYSNVAGALVVPVTSTIKTVNDLAGKRLGIAGGELDKNWLLLQALGKQNKIDLNTNVEKVFGAPPLINEQLKNNRVDAVLTYWHFAAQLEALGYKSLLDGQMLQQSLGVTENVPTLGYVFRESWGNAHKALLQDFFTTTKEAKNRLCNDDELWKKATLKLETTSPMLRERYCNGRVNYWSLENQKAAQELYRILFKLNPKVGTSENLAPGTFWQSM